MRARFHAEPIVQATELLLQERTPRDVAWRARVPRRSASGAASANLPPACTPLPFAARSDAAHPRALERPLRGDDYRGRIGLRRWRDLAITRWREDVTRDPWEPTSYPRRRQRRGVVGGVSAERGRAGSITKSRFQRTASNYETRRTITTTLDSSYRGRRTPRSAGVARKLGARVSRLELTSYSEVVLATPATTRHIPRFRTSSSNGIRGRARHASGNPP